MNFLPLQAVIFLLPFYFSLRMKENLNSFKFRCRGVRENTVPRQKEIKHIGDDPPKIRVYINKDAGDQSLALFRVGFAIFVKLTAGTGWNCNWAQELMHTLVLSTKITEGTCSMAGDSVPSFHFPCGLSCKEGGPKGPSTVPPTGCACRTNILLHSK